MDVGWKKLIWSIAGVIGAGCAAQKPLPAPLEPPAAFENQLADRAAAWPSKEWYRGFGSEQLNSLIDLASKNNGDLAQSRARIQQADARARQAGAAILPAVDATGTGNFLAGHSSGGSGHEFDWSAMLSASYEVDFWGKKRATINSALFLATAAHIDQETVALTTLAGVANAYFQLLAVRERLTIAHSNADAAKTLVDAIQARFDAGSASPVELATQKATLGTALIVITELEQQHSEGRAALALLIGRVPEGFDIEYAPFDSMTEPLVGAGLPSELLRRRPDLMVAEANLRSAHADVAVARAAMFPSLNLTAAAGLQNPALNAAILAVPGTGSSLAITGTLVQPIFNHGKLRAQHAEVQAKSDELVAAYRTAIIAALIDTENALAAISHLDAARALQVDTIAQAQRAFDGAKLRYQAGSGDFLTLLDAQRTLYTARDQYVLYRLARLQALVSLCKALGGGWDSSAPGAIPVVTQEKWKTSR